MYFDALTLAAVRDEIGSSLLGGRVERVIHPADLAVAFEIYAGGPKRWLLASAHPQQAHVHLAREKLARVSEDVSPLLLLLRKYVRDARLTEVEQPAWERVLSLVFAKRDDEGHPVASRVIIEVIGRYSNIVLVNAEGRVLDAIKRVKPEINRYRTVLPQQEYVAPPPQSKARPDSLQPGDLRRLLAAATPETPVSQALVGALAGFSPLVGRELAYRASGNADARLAETDLEHLETETLALVKDVVAGNWRPCLGLSDGAVAAYAAYELRQFPGRREVGSISEALDEFYAQPRASVPAPARAGETGKVALRGTIRLLVDRTRRRRVALAESLPRQEEIERLRHQGELLLAYGSQVAPGSATAELAGEVVHLDSALTPVENAQRLFHDYQRAKSGLQEVPPLIERAEAELSFLDQVLNDLDLASSPAEVEEVRQELAQAGLLKALPGKRKAKDRVLPLGRPVVSSDGFEILIGRSARQNERVTFEMGSGGDLWLHARGVPGAHVLVKARGQQVPERTVREAAAYAAYFSTSRQATAVPVDYTLQRYVKKVKGGPPGLAIYSGEKTLQAKPNAPPAR